MLVKGKGCKNFAVVETVAYLDGSNVIFVSKCVSTVLLFLNQTDEDKHTHIIICSSSSEDLMKAPLLPRNMRAGRRSSWLGSRYRLAFAVATATAACAGLCALLQHPEQVALLSTSLRRCLWSR